jgi:hypothetical protein
VLQFERIDVTNARVQADLVVNQEKDCVLAGQRFVPG